MTNPGSLSAEAQGIYCTTSPNTSQFKITNLLYEGILNMQSASSNGNLFGVHPSMTGSISISGEVTYQSSLTRTGYINTNSTTFATDRVGDKDIIVRHSTTGTGSITLSSVNRKNGDTMTVFFSSSGEKTINGSTITAPARVRLAFVNGVWATI